MRREQRLRRIVGERGQVGPDFVADAAQAVAHRAALGEHGRPGLGIAGHRQHRAVLGRAPAGDSTRSRRRAAWRRDCLDLLVLRRAAAAAGAWRRCRRRALACSRSRPAASRSTVAGSTARRESRIAAPARGSSNRPTAPRAPGRCRSAPAPRRPRSAARRSTAARAAPPATRCRRRAARAAAPNSRTARRRSSSGALSSATTVRAKSNILASSFVGSYFSHDVLRRVQRVEQTGQRGQLPGGVFASVGCADRRKRRRQRAIVVERRWPGRPAVRAARPAARRPARRRAPWPRSRADCRASPS